MGKFTFNIISWIYSTNCFKIFMHFVLFIPGIEALVTCSYGLLIDWTSYIPCARRPTLTDMQKLWKIIHSVQRKGRNNGKAIPLQSWAGPEGSRRLRLPDFKTIGTYRRQGCQPYTRSELIYLAPLGSENISAPYFKQYFFQGGVLLPQTVKHHASQSQDRNNKYFILYIEFCIDNKI